MDIHCIAEITTTNTLDGDGQASINSVISGFLPNLPNLRTGVVPKISGCEIVLKFLIFNAIWLLKDINQRLLNNTALNMAYELQLEMIKEKLNQLCVDSALYLKEKSMMMMMKIMAVQGKERRHLILSTSPLSDPKTKGNI